jgi:hypothetical protein
VNKFKQQIDREDIRAMESRGSNSLSRILNQLASEPRPDELSIEEFMDMKYELQKREYLKNNPGKTEEDYKEEIIKLSLKDGGSVIDLSKYRKDKEPVEVKEIDLASLFTPGKTLASLTEKEKDVVNQMLRLTLGKK